MDESAPTAADPAYGNGGGRAGGFHNIDELPLGKLLKTKFSPGGKLKKKFGGMGKVAKLRTQGFK